MSMRVRYAGEFLSLSGSVWRCEILQEADTDFTVGELVFPLDPLQIDWDFRSPEEPVCGSLATLRIESPGDRTYADLYTEIPGEIRLDVYRDSALYWSGCLDTETYREPYDRGFRYDVELVFYDFGHLGRIPYNLTGRKTLYQILEAALAAANLNFTGVNQDYISTKFLNNAALSLGALTISSENFIDEDGKAFDFEKVLQGILQPLALKLIQKAGQIWVYDINGLYGKPDTEQIEWDGTGQELETNEVYNNIRVTFSPYSSAVLTKPLEYGDTYGPEYTNLTSDVEDPECYSYYVDYDSSHRHGYSWDYNLIDFTIFLSKDATKCKGLAEIGSGNAFFKILPNLGGEESEGVAVGFYTGGHGPLSGGWPVLKGISPGAHPETLAMRTERIWIQNVDEETRKQHFVKILMEMLADPRYNPFEDAPEDGSGNENENYAAVKSWGQQAFVAVDIVLYGGRGQALYHYTNNNITRYGHLADSVANCSATQNNGTPVDGWVPGEASFGDCWLSYYELNADRDLIEGCGITGWKANRQSFGKPWSSGATLAQRKMYYYEGGTKPWWSFESFRRAPEGQFIPYPPQSGYLEIRVYNGVYVFDDQDGFSETGAGGFANQGLYQKLRWLLYKVPEVSVVRRTLTFDDADVDDIEYSGVCNVNAQEELAIDTICGTMEDVCPTARGLLYRSATDLPVSQLKRAGRTESAEQLLIGTLYSQHATRKTALTGEVALVPGGITLYEDAAQPSGTKFLAVSETQHVRDDTSESTFVEVRPDEYTAE